MALLADRNWEGSQDIPETARRTGHMSAGSHTDSLDIPETALLADRSWEDTSAVQLVRNWDTLGSLAGVTATMLQRSLSLDKKAGENRERRCLGSYRS
jgi:hypothetical protein